MPNKKHRRATASIEGTMVVDHASPALRSDDPTDSQRLQPWIAVLFAVLAAAITISTIVTVFITYTPLPRSDHWAVVFWLKKYYAGNWHVSDLWSQHNEHRILFPRLFFLADLFVFHGSNVFLLCSMFLLQAIHAGIFIYEFRSWKTTTESCRAVLTAMAIALFFSGSNLANLYWPFQLCFVLAGLAGTLSVRSFLRHGEALASPEPTTRHLAAAFAYGTVASYSLASGILIWPVLAMMAVVLRFRIRTLLLTCIAGGINVAFYVYGYQPISQHTNVGDAFTHPLQILAYVCAYLALPVSKLNHFAGLLVGLAALVFLAYETFVLCVRPAIPRIMKMAFAIMLFVTAGAFGTAAGRMSMSSPEDNMRYATPVNVFWLCGMIVLLADNTLFGRSQPNIRRAAVFAGAGTFLVIAVLSVHLSEVSRFVTLTADIRNAELALGMDVAALAPLGTIFPDPSEIFELSDVLRNHRLSIFAGDPIAPGEDLGRRHRVVDRTRCSGVWEWTTPIEASTRPGESAEGWAWDSSANGPPRMVLIADATGIIRGAARFTRSREDVAGARRNPRMLHSGWFGFAQRGSGEGQYRAYAILNDGQSACPIDNLSDVHTSTLAVLRHGAWFVNSNGNRPPGAGVRSFDFGLEGDYPVVGDWDGSGVIRAGVFRGGEWFLDWNNNGRWDEGDRRFSFGKPGDLPVVADWNHTGIAQIGVFRNGLWMIDSNGDHAYESSDRQFALGLAGDIPVAGDWDGSGKVRAGVYRRGTWLLDWNGDFQYDSRDKTFAFGLTGDQPVVGDWTGLGVTRVGVFRDGMWYLDSNGNFRPDPEDRVLSFGLPRDKVVVWP
jgi:hypothetical protein